MLITGLEEFDKSKIKVFIDGEYAFWLLGSESEQYGLENGAELSPSDYDRLLEDTVFNHAKQKALNALKFMDRTEQELRIKLSDACFPADIIQKTISYVIEYGYLDDTRFASAFIRSRKSKKSKLAIKMELIQKGMRKDIIDRAILEEYEREDLEEDAELTAIKKAVEKKVRALETLTPEGRQKLMASLFRKGFEINKIKQVLEEYGL